MTIKTHENMDCVKEDVLENGIMQGSEVSNLAGISRMYVKFSPLKWILGDWFLHHDHEPGHSDLSVQEFLATKKNDLLPSPPLFPKLAL
jgi:hypothetical protein